MSRALRALLSTPLNNLRVFSREGAFLGEHAPPGYTRLGLASTNGTHLLVTDELAHRVYCLAVGGF